MPDRYRLHLRFWLAYSLVLLAPVVAAPLWTLGSVTESARPYRLFHDLVLFSAQPTAHLDGAMTTDAILPVNALPFENEEQDRPDALDEPRLSFLIPRSFRESLDRQSIAPQSIPSLYPLRC